MNDSCEIISLINTNNPMYGRSRCCSEVRNEFNRGDTNGRIGYYLNFNFEKLKDDNNSRDMLLNYLRMMPVSRSLSIDACFLEDEEILSILREKDIKEIRIIDSAFIITQEILDKFNDDVLIVVDNCENSCLDEHRILVQNGIFKREINYLGDDLVSAYFIDHELSDVEIDKLVSVINNDCFNEIKHLSLRFYNPSKYKELLVKLRDRGLDEKVQISLLGNPLYDVSDAYNGLDSIGLGQITIIYDTCSDMIELYSKEPFSVSNYYQSELEGGGRASLESYRNLLSVLEEQENHIKKMGYSSLEAHIYAYRYLQKNYGYDPDFENTDKNNYLTNRQLDVVAGMSKTVCAGYATLYSALMRRCGYPTFRYATEKHVRNISRIKDEKYGVDSIGILDPTFDGSKYDENGKFIENNSFSFFMIPPQYMTLWKDSSEFMTIPTAMVVDMPLYEQYFSKSPAQYMYDFDYLAFGYMLTALDRMGFEIPDGENVTEEDYREFLKKLSSTSIFDEISIGKFVEAYSQVLLKENERLDSREVIDELSNARTTKYLKNKSFNVAKQPSILKNISLDGKCLYDVDGNGNAYSIGEVVVSKLYSDEKTYGVSVSDLEKKSNLVDSVREGVIDSLVDDSSIKELILLDDSCKDMVPYIKKERGLVSMKDEKNMLVEDEFVESVDVFEVVRDGLGEIRVSEGDMPVTNSYVEEVAGEELEEIQVSEGDMPVTNLYVEEVVGEGLEKIELDDLYSYIPGTLIKKPRSRYDDESDEEYLDYLGNYYSKYYPKAVQNANEYRLVKSDIIQDLPIYSLEPSRYIDINSEDNKVLKYTK